MRPLTTIAALLIAASLAGCVSYEDLHAKTPIRTAEVSGDYRSVGACTLQSLLLSTDGTPQYTPLDLGDQRVYRIISSASGMIGTYGYIWEASFIQEPDQMIRVEMRARKGLAGPDGGYNYPSQFFSSVGDCAKPHLAASDSPTKR